MTTKGWPRHIMRVTDHALVRFFERGAFEID